MTRYSILKRKAHAPTGRGTGNNSILTGSVTFTLASENLSAQELNEVVGDPETELIAQEMPVSLINPVAEPFCQKSWGIFTETHISQGLEDIRALSSPYSGRGVTVAVLDTGIEQTHDCFRGMSILSRDFTGEGIEDRNGHGTHCAGTIFGRDVNGSRIGVARGVEHAYIAKVLSDTGNGTSDMVYSGMLWALEQKADIISMSLGFDFPGMVVNLTNDGWPVDLATSTALDAFRNNLRMFDAIMAVARAQSFVYSPLIIAASGNESRRSVDSRLKISCSLPAAAEGVISVSAVVNSGNEVYRAADFSNINATLCAPGVDIVSAWPNNTFKSLSGTSMACPHVAGVAALWWEERRRSGLRPSAKNVSARLIATARRDVFSHGNTELDTGQGLITSPA
ncbi:S8 family peptidase [Pantoea stewartii]|uniref:S8 family peptidase n=1 Tax=Pantoea stewartii TaxID=66269 RepID=UPI0025A0EAB0|nr:S8 family serine peptidase [Pantoea stewartii]